jgi:hypothetical protein
MIAECDLTFRASATAGYEVLSHTVININLRLMNRGYEVVFDDNCSERGDLPGFRRNSGYEVTR